MPLSGLYLDGTGYAGGVPGSEGAAEGKSADTNRKAEKRMQLITIAGLVVSIAAGLLALAACGAAKRADERLRALGGKGEEWKSMCRWCDAKWETCYNPECPYCTDFCPVTEHPEICRCCETVKGGDVDGTV